MAKENMLAIIFNIRTIHHFIKIQYSAEKSS